MACAIAAVPYVLPVARFIVEQYHRMIASGALEEDDVVELIEGWAVRKMAKGPAHAYVTGPIEGVLRAHAGAGLHVRNQEPITLAASEPEPDLCVVRGGRERFRSAHPGAADVLLVVEIADSSLSTDRVKARSYGAGGIADYSLVDLPERCFEVHTAPSAIEDRGYARTEMAREPAELVLRLEGAERARLDLGSVLPPVSVALSRPRARRAGRTDPGRGRAARASRRRRGRASRA